MTVISSTNIIQNIVFKDTMKLGKVSGTAYLLMC